MGAKKVKPAPKGQKKGAKLGRKKELAKAQTLVNMVNLRGGNVP